MFGVTLALALGGDGQPVVNCLIIVEETCFLNAGASHMSTT